jgi:superfamily II RNA helicase
MSVVTHKTGPCTELITEMAVTFPYEADDFQKHSFNAMESGEHVLVTAHTGSGKTTVAEYAVAYGLKSGKKIIYTAPIKALSNQIFGDFSRKYPSWSLGIRTGDIDFRSEEAQVIIMTTEILQNMLYREGATAGESGSLPNIDLKDVAVVIFDEVHYIKDRDRGSVWERSIMMMPSHIQMIMLSATLPDADKFCEWIADCKKRNITHTTTPFRAVPLTHYMLTHKGRRLIMDKNNNFKTEEYVKAAKEYNFFPSELNHYIKQVQLPALFFCFSKKLCQDHAHCVQIPLVSIEEQREISKLFMNLLRKFQNHQELLKIKQTLDVQSLVAKGVCFHHAGLLPPLKEIIQELFSQGLIKVLFVTETFAAGVNMPAKTVVFTGFSKFDNHVNGFRTLLPEEYGQMSGRAGRRGMDTMGTVIHLPFNQGRMLSAHDAKEMMCGKIQNITSRIQPDYHHIFNAILGQGGSGLESNGSLLNRQTNERLTYCKSALSELESKKLSIDTGDMDVVVDEEFLEKISYHQKFHNGQLGKKSAKNYHKSGTEDWYIANETACRRYLSKEKKLTEIDKEIDHLSEEHEALEYGESDDIDRAIEFLHSNGYLSASRELEDYTAEDVTVKGIMASGINEANTLMLTELIVEDYLEDLNKEELISVLAVFLPTKDMERETILPRKIQQRIKSIGDYAEIFEHAEWQHSPCNSNWKIHKEFCDMAYLWSQGHSVGRVYSETKSTVQVGEFARMMVKLNNVCKETLRAAQLCHKDLLCKKLSECHELLIRNVVTPQSLYVTSSSASLKKG